MGFSFTTTHQALEIKDNQNFYTNSGHAPMGWGLPASIGAFYAKKDSKITNNLLNWRRRIPNEYSRTGNCYAQ